MAQNQNGSNSGGICKKFYKKLSFSTASDHPADPVSSHKKRNATFSSPKILPNRNEQRPAGKPPPENARREVTIVDEKGHDHKAAESVPRKERVMPRGNVGNDVVNDAKPPASNVPAANKDEGKFSDYIRKVKNRMRTVSNVGAGKTAPTARRDSFNDKVSHYINRAKFKIRTTSDVGMDKDASFK